MDTAITRSANEAYLSLSNPGYPSLHAGQNEQSQTTLTAPVMTFNGVENAPSLNGGSYMEHGYQNGGSSISVIKTGPRPPVSLETMTTTTATVATAAVTGGVTGTNGLGSHKFSITRPAFSSAAGNSANTLIESSITRPLFQTSVLSKSESSAFKVPGFFADSLNEIDLSVAPISLLSTPAGSPDRYWPPTAGLPSQNRVLSPVKEITGPDRPVNVLFSPPRHLFNRARTNSDGSDTLPNGLSVYNGARRLSMHNTISPVRRQLALLRERSNSLSRLISNSPLVSPMVVTPTSLLDGAVGGPHSRTGSMVIDGDLGLAGFPPLLPPPKVASTVGNNTNGIQGLERVSSGIRIIHELDSSQRTNDGTRIPSAPASMLSLRSPPAAVGGSQTITSSTRNLRPTAYTFLRSSVPKTTLTQLSRQSSAGRSHTLAVPNTHSALLSPTPSNESANSAVYPHSDSGQQHQAQHHQLPKATLQRMQSDPPSLFTQAQAHVLGSAHRSQAIDLEIQLAEHLGRLHQKRETRMRSYSQVDAFVLSPASILVDTAGVKPSSTKAKVEWTWEEYEEKLAIFSEVFERVIQYDSVYGYLLRRIKEAYDEFCCGSRDMASFLASPPSSLASATSVSERIDLPVQAPSNLYSPESSPPDRLYAGLPRRLMALVEENKSLHERLARFQLFHADVATKNAELTQRLGAMENRNSQLTSHTVNVDRKFHDVQRILDERDVLINQLRAELLNAHQSIRLPSNSSMVPQLPQSQPPAPGVVSQEDNETKIAVQPRSLPNGSPEHHMERRKKQRLERKHKRAQDRSRDFSYSSNTPVAAGTEAVSPSADGLRIEVSPGLPDIVGDSVTSSSSSDDAVSPLVQVPSDQNTQDDDAIATPMRYPRAVATPDVSTQTDIVYVDPTESAPLPTDSLAIPLPRKKSAPKFKKERRSEEVPSKIVSCDSASDPAAQTVMKTVATSPIALERQLSHLSALPSPSSSEGASDDRAPRRSSSKSKQKKYSKSRKKGRRHRKHRQSQSRRRKHGHHHHRKRRSSTSSSHSSTDSSSDTESSETHSSAYDEEKIIYLAESPAPASKPRPPIVPPLSLEKVPTSEEERRKAEERERLRKEREQDHAQQDIRSDVAITGRASTERKSVVEHPSEPILSLREQMRRASSIQNGRAEDNGPLEDSSLSERESHAQKGAISTAMAMDDAISGSSGDPTGAGRSDPHRLSRLAETYAGEEEPQRSFDDPPAASHHGHRDSLSSQAPTLLLDAIRQEFDDTYDFAQADVPADTSPNYTRITLPPVRDSDSTPYMPALAVPLSTSFVLDNNSINVNEALSHLPQMQHSLSATTQNSDIPGNRRSFVASGSEDELDLAELEHGASPEPTPSV